MSREAITTAILDKANAAAAEKLAAAELSRAEKLAAANKQVEEERAARADSLKRDSDEAYDRRMTLARLEGRIAVLGVKQQVIEKAYAAAAEKLEKMPAKDYQDIFTKLVAAYAEKGDVLIVGAPDASRLDKKWTDAVCAKAGITAKGSFDGRGVILSGASSEKDLTLGVLLAEARERTESDVAKMLFGQDQ